MIKGIREKQTLLDLKHGLLNEGGRFIVYGEGNEKVVDLIMPSSAESSKDNPKTSE